ncbi:MAG: FAD:protein FMN transferase [Verrucomicrobiota bacterium]
MRIVALAAAALALLAGCVTHPKLVEERFEFQRPQMGVPFRIVLYATNQAHADLAANAAYARISQLNDILTDYDSGSELSRLSKTAGTGQAIKLSDDLWRVLAAAQTIARKSDGAFDVTVGPVVGLWRKIRRVKQMPPQDVIDDFRKPVGYEKLVLDERVHTSTLTVPGMKLDVGGIAKGYAADEAIKVLRTNGVPRALVAGSGDITVSDAPPGKAGWRIEIAPLDVTNAPPSRFVYLQNQALASSGDVFQHVEIGGVRYSHIVDPKTGIGLTGHNLVTIIARDGTTADAFATAVCVLGPAKGMALAEKQPGMSAKMVRLVNGTVEEFTTKSFGK